MKNTLKFLACVEDVKRQPVRREIYEQSVDLYNEGKPMEAFHRLLDFLNEGFRTKFGNEDGTEFHIPHGSIVVHIRISEDTMHIESDFLNLPEKGQVAMLRQVADLNINKLLLADFVKEGNKLKMRYVTPLQQSHPHKIYGVLQNICNVGDRYDDEFQTKFAATHCYAPQVTPYSAETVDYVYEGIQTLGKATLDALNEYNALRHYGYSWNVLDTTFYQIAYFANPQGQFYNDLEKAIDDLDAERPIEELVSKGMDYLRKLLDTPKEQLAKDLYFVEKLVSNRRNASLQTIQEVFENVYNEATEAAQSGDFERATVRMLYIIYETFFYNDIPQEISTMLTHALQASGGQPMEQAAHILYETMNNIMEGDLTSNAFSDFANNPLKAAQAMQQTVTEKLKDFMKGFFN